jgi:hypothetical protein
MAMKKWLIGMQICACLCGFSVFAQKVPIHFDQYHGFTGTEKYLKEVARNFPDITDLKVIGRSTMNRPVYVLIISSKKTGTPLDRYVPLRNIRSEGVDNVPKMTSDQAKPGHWICGSTHGNEYTGTEVCLYIIDKLVSGYSDNPEITSLVDSTAFYLCPIVNPDGVYNSVERDLSQRGNSLHKDDDLDGKINEDGPDDLDGDGRITYFRYRDTKGNYIQDEIDPRVMIRLGDKEITEKQRWSVIREDKDNDGDKKRGEDGEQGFDLNRNYPEGWFDDKGFRGGTGDYPTSAPEVQAMAEFFSNHHNIMMAQFFHTSGGFTYRPMGVSSDESMHPKDIAVYDLILGKKYAEMMGDDPPLAWIYPDSIPIYRQRLEAKKASKYAIARGYEMPVTWVVSYNEKENRRYGFGLQSDWAYQEMGMLSLTTELFNYRTDLPGHTFAGDDAYTRFQRAAIKYQEEKAGGKWFREWRAYRHPELGEGEIGGWLPQYQGNAFPGEMLESICETHWQYEKYRASLLPHVIVREATGTVIEKSGRYRIVEITATVENLGKLATNLARGAELPGNRTDVVWLIGNRDEMSFIQGLSWQTTGVLGGTMTVPGFANPKSTAEIKWLVKIQGDNSLTVVVSSLKGGTCAKEVTLK